MLVVVAVLRRSEASEDNKRLIQPLPPTITTSTSVAKLRSSNPNRPHHQILIHHCITTDHFVVTHVYLCWSCSLIILQHYHAFKDPPNSVSVQLRKRELKGGQRVCFL
ncbi:hypothetical protein L2E82_40463 [Cichorium intybus]|uniref:Uncharacterized protein n=1 Tax=Cichorium intybus TaxID=13427 RepID=A0ACB9AKU9_CICIN|nr:hypothetical protein L2E82_40463 [Cichorium intybus]